jgi:hypothetical protein
MHRARLILDVSGFGWVWLVAIPALLALASGLLALGAMSMPGRTGVFGPPGAGAIHAGAHVEVAWHEGSYPATVLAVVGDGAYNVRYDGWDSSWDEVVGTSRIVGRR